MPRSLKLFTFFASSTFVLGSVGYLVLQAVVPHGRVFGALYRMFLYHDEYPFQYIMVVALTYAVIATACALRWSHLLGWRRFATIVVVIVATILIASVPGGVLWKLHDMQAGYFPTGARFWGDLFWGASMGLQVGWLVIALSPPFNIIGLVVGYAVTIYGFKIGLVTSKSLPL